LDFATRFAQGESARSIKSDPEFIAMREHVLNLVFTQNALHAAPATLHVQKAG